MQSINRNIELTGVADSPAISAEDARGQLGTHIPIVLNSSLLDVDGSESMVLRLRGIPVGIAISDSIRQVVSESASNWYDISNFELTKLHLVTSGGVDGTFELEFSSTAVEGSNQNEATSTVRFEVIIDQVLPVFELNNELPVSTSESTSASPDQGLDKSTDETSSTTAAVIEGAGEIVQEFIIVMEQLSDPLATLDDSDDLTEVNELRELDSRESLSFELSTFEIGELNTYRNIHSMDSAVSFEGYSYANMIGFEAAAQVFIGANSVDGVTGVNSAVLMMWNMIRFTISTLPSSRDQDIVDDVRYSQTNHRSQRR